MLFLYMAFRCAFGCENPNRQQRYSISVKCTQKFYLTCSENDKINPNFTVKASHIQFNSSSTESHHSALNYTRLSGRQFCLCLCRWLCTEALLSLDLECVCVQLEYALVESNYYSLLAVVERKIVRARWDVRRDVNIVRFRPWLQMAVLTFGRSLLWISLVKINSKWNISTKSQSSWEYLRIGSCI